MFGLLVNSDSSFQIIRPVCLKYFRIQFVQLLTVFSRVLTIKELTNISNKRHSSSLIQTNDARLCTIVLSRSSTASLLGVTGYTQKPSKISKVGTAATVHTSNTSDLDTSGCTTTGSKVPDDI